jgi:hypothetical protein
MSKIAIARKPNFQEYEMQYTTGKYLPYLLLTSLSVISLQYDNFPSYLCGVSDLYLNLFTL